MKYLFYSVVAICVTVLLLFLINKYGIADILFGLLVIVAIAAWAVQSKDD